MKWFTEVEKREIIKAYTINLEPTESIAKRYNKTRQAILKMLKKNGVDTSDHLWSVICHTCGKEILTQRCKIRGRINHYCNSRCYFAALAAGNGYPLLNNRQGQRTGRRIVGQWFDLKKDNIVHHEDRNTLNNLKWNLKVFANQGDHIRHHRDVPVNPIWDGSVHSTYPS